LTAAPVFLADRSSFAGDSVVLAGPEGRHAATVRRLRPGEHAELTDGAGSVASCVVTAVSGATVTFEVQDRSTVPRAEPLLTVVQALPKGDRGELAVETMTEAGVDTIVPWAAERCVVQWRGDKASRGAARWRSAAREAAKQARRGWLPEVADLASRADVAARIAKADRAIVLEADADAALSALPLPDAGEIVLIVGPEGGISPQERADFTAAGAVECRLGPTVLRTSTAGVAAAAVILARSARW
jgi:16S rRNA (uracil1498-N3)-methyltransferase